MTEGYVLIGIGEKYLKMVELFADTLRHHGDNRDIYVISDTTDEPLFGECKTEFEKYGTLPKITLNKNLPFDHNIFLDADMLCIGNTEHVWDTVKSRDSFISQLGVPDDFKHYGGRLATTAKDLGWQSIPPRVQGGFIYLRKEGLNEEFFDWMQNDGFVNYGDYCEPGTFRGASRTDQVLYSLAHAKYGLSPIDMRENAFMTFLDSCDTGSVPTNVVWFKSKPYPQDNKVAFCHCMAKPGHPLYDRLYNESLAS